MTATYSDTQMLMIGVMVIALLLVLFVWPWFRLRSVRRDLKSVQTERDTAQLELRRVIEDFEIQGRSLRATIANKDGEHRRALKSMSERASRLATELAGAKKEIGDVNEEIGSLRKQVGYAPGLAARVRHDIPKRMKRLWPFLDRKLQHSASEDERAFLKEELFWVVQKIELHLVSEDNLQEFVKNSLATVMEQRRTDPTTAPKLVSLSEYLRWLVASNEWQQVDFDDVTACRVEGIWMHWELMLTNILSNADYYSQPERNDGRQGRISIATRMMGKDRVAIDITNDGPHVELDVPDKVFELGFTTKEDGRGLGLTIARAIARGLGGDVQTPANIGRNVVGKSRVRFRLTGLPVVAGDG